MVLHDDNSLIDTEKNKITDENKIIQPLQDKELETFDHYTSSEIEKFVIRLSDRDKYLVDDEHFNSNKIINYLDKFNIHNKSFDPYIPHNTGFSLSLLNGKKLLLKCYHFERNGKEIKYIGLYSGTSCAAASGASGENFAIS